MKEKTMARKMLDDAYDLRQDIPEAMFILLSIQLADKEGRVQLEFDRSDETEETFTCIFTDGSRIRFNKGSIRVLPQLKDQGENNEQ